MVTIFGYQIPLPPALQFLGNDVGSFVGTVLAWAVIALIVYFALTYLLRWLSYHLPGEIEEIVLSILRKPVLFLIIVFGAVDSLKILPLPAGFVGGLERILKTTVILVGIYLAWRVIEDIVVYYGTAWARNTESRVDDVIIPMINLFGPLLVLVIGCLIILPLWGTST